MSTSQVQENDSCPPATSRTYIFVGVLATEAQKVSVTLSSVFSRVRQTRVINRSKPDDSKLLHKAAVDGDLTAIELLLTDTCVDVNKVDGSGLTVLHRAAWRGHDEVVRLLLNQPGIRVNSRDADGCTPLDRAMSAKRNDVVQLLRENGALQAIGQDNHVSWRKSNVVLSGECVA